MLRGLHPDIAVPHYRSPQRHLFIDVSITAPDSATALSSTPSSRDTVGAAAAERTRRKQAKYSPACQTMGALFRAAVIERYGACADELCGLVRMVCGDGERELAADDWCEQR